MSGQLHALAALHKSLIILWIRGWVDLRVSLDVLANKIPAPTVSSSHYYLP